MIVLIVENKSKETDYFRSRENLFWGLENEAQQVGYKLQDMVLSCQFERHKCEDDDFVLFQYPELFNCYTFKKGRNSNLTTVHGLGGALSLVLYTEPQGNDISYIYDDLVVANNRGLCKLLHVNHLKNQTNLNYFLLVHVCLLHEHFRF